MGGNTGGYLKISAQIAGANFVRVSFSLMLQVPAETQGRLIVSHNRL